MDGISWTHATQRLAIHRRWELPAVLSLGKTKTPDPAKDWQRVRLREIDETRRIIVFAKSQLSQLRHLLARDCYNVCAMTDIEVLDRVVIMLVRGEWVLLERRTTETGKQSLDSGAAARSTRAVVPDPPVPRRLPSKQAEGVASSIEEAAETFDQDTQAATFRLAAANGTPFCEICEERKRDRKKPGRSGVPA